MPTKSKGHLEFLQGGALEVVRRFSVQIFVGQTSQPIGPDGYREGLRKASPYRSKFYVQA